MGDLVRSSPWKRSGADIYYNYSPESRLYYDRDLSIIGNGFRGLIVKINSDTASAYNFYYRSRGTEASPGQVLANDFLGSFGFRGYHTTNYHTLDGARFSAMAEEDYTSSSQATSLIFYTTPTGSTGPSQRMILKGDGRIGIGQAAPTSLVETTLHLSSTGTTTTLGQLNTNLRIQTNTSTANAGGEISFRGTSNAAENVATYAAISAPVTGNGATGAAGYLSFSTKATTTTTSLTERMRIVAGGNIGIGTSDPQVLFELSNGAANGSMRIGGNVNANTNNATSRKIGRIVGPSYTGAGTGTNGFILGYDAQSTFTAIDFGGIASGTPFAATLIRFYTESTIEVNGGQLAMQINENQHILIGTQSDGGTTGGSRLQYNAGQTGTTLSLLHGPSFGNTNSTVGNMSGITFSQAFVNASSTVFGAAIMGVHVGRTGGARVSDLAFYTMTANSTAERMRLLGAGRLGIGEAAPTATLHIKAGVAAANGAPLKFTSGTNLTSAEAGAMEYDGTNLYFSPSTTRRTVYLLPTTPQTYTASNVVTDRSYDADATSIDELADVLGTLIADLRAENIIA